MLTTLVSAPGQLLYLTSDLHLGGELKPHRCDLVAAISAATTPKLRSSRSLWVLPGADRGSGSTPWLLDGSRLSWGSTAACAPDDLREGYMSRVWLAEGLEAASQVTGGFFFRREPETRVHADVRNTTAQDLLLEAYAQRTGATLS